MSAAPEPPDLANGPLSRSPRGTILALSTGRYLGPSRLPLTRVENDPNRDAAVTRFRERR